MPDRTRVKYCKGCRMYKVVLPGDPYPTSEYCDFCPDWEPRAKMLSRKLATVDVE